MTAFPSQGAPWGPDFQPEEFEVQEITDSTSVRAVLNALLRDGLCLVHGLDSGSSDHIWNLTQTLFRHESANVVHHAFWDAREVKEAIYLNQFTNRSEIEEGYHVSYGFDWLPPHTDGTFLPLPPRVKVLGTYEFKGDPTENTFIDGYFAMDQLSVNDQSHLRSEVVTHWIKSDPESAPMRADRTIIGEDEEGRRTIAWNAHDRAGKAQHSDPTPQLTEALSQMEACVNDLGNAFRVELLPGMAAIMDNWRVLHGRQTLHGGLRRVAGADISNQALHQMWNQVHT